jgi:hypothetical protein
MEKIITKKGEILKLGIRVQNGTGNIRGVEHSLVGGSIRNGSGARALGGSKIIRDCNLRPWHKIGKTREWE